MPEVILDKVTKRYKEVVALEELSLVIRDKEYVTILGPSGCGKTTILKMIAGIEEPTSGKIYINGRCVNRVPIDERDLGYVFQNIALFPHMNVWSNVSYSPMVKGWELKKTRAVSEEMLTLVDILERRESYPKELSGGMQQKTSLARALASKARLLLLDEPLSALDVRVRFELRYELRKFVKDLGLTAIHVTHDQEEAMSVSDKIVIVKNGKIVEIGTPEELYNRPKTLFTANFLGESNFIEGVVSRFKNGKIEIELKNMQKLDLQNGKFEMGAPIVAAIRPENIVLQSESTTLSKYSMKGTVKGITFTGPFYRYEVLLENGENMKVDIPATKHQKININQTVMLSFDSDKLLIYPYPKEGLMEAIKLE